MYSMPWKYQSGMIALAMIPRDAARYARKSWRSRGATAAIVNIVARQATARMARAMKVDQKIRDTAARSSRDMATSREALRLNPYSVMRMKYWVYACANENSPNRSMPNVRVRK